MSTQTPPNVAPVNPEAVPPELRNRPRWVNWRAELREGKNGKPAEWTKPPLIAGTDRHATVTNPAHYRDFPTAHAASQARQYGVGFVLGDGVVGVDLDDCIDAATNTLSPSASRVVQAVASYTEVSPSGTGVKIFALGTVSQSLKRGSAEIYGGERFFTVTGRAFPSLPSALTHRPDELAAIFTLVTAMTAKNRDRLWRLWGGAIDGYPSHSEADLAFLRMLAPFTDDDAMLDRLIRLSGLMRDKWDEQHGAQTYGEATIAKAREGDGTERTRRPSQATTLVDLIQSSGAELFHDADGEPFVTLPVGNHRETMRLDSRTFRDNMAARFYAEHQASPGAQALKDATNTLAGIARFEGPEHATFVRVARHEGEIFLDLGDAERRVVRVDTAGWRVMPDSPVKFRQPRGMLPLPEPTRNGSLDALRSILDPISDDDFVLAVAWELAALKGDGPYPVLAISGEQGSGKSTRGRILRQLTDPNRAPLRSEPREERDLAVSAANGHVIGFDNLSAVPSWLSDALCRLATGGGFSTRTLYENDEETLFDYTRPALFTAITDIATRGDLLDRVIALSLPVIQRRRTEAEIRAAFDAAWPGILGALLDGVSEALRRHGSITVERLPRMADFALWVEAASPALGWTPGAFLSAYERNRERANDLAMESLPIANVLCTVMDRQPRGEWQGTASDLLDVLTTNAAPGVTLDKGWPKRAHVLSGQLTRLAPNLRRVGIDVEVGIRTSGGKQRLVRIRRHGASSGAERADVPTGSTSPNGHKPNPFARPHPVGAAR